jgi:hypothetical protein
VSYEWVERFLQHHLPKHDAESVIERLPWHDKKSENEPTVKKQQAGYEPEATITDLNDNRQSQFGHLCHRCKGTGFDGLCLHCGGSGWCSSWH